VNVWVVFNIFYSFIKSDKSRQAAAGPAFLYLFIEQ